MNNHHIIFEGPELVGKSYVMSQVYDALEKKYNTNKNILNGCHWFNCDVGIFGSELGKPVIEGYLRIFETLKDTNSIVEKFHISDRVYNRMYNGENIDYADVEKKLQELGFKIVFLTMESNEALVEKRLQDRLSLYPHYMRIKKPPTFYLKQQKEYVHEAHYATLPHKTFEITTLPNPELISDVLRWMDEDTTA